MKLINCTLFLWLTVLLSACSAINEVENDLKRGKTNALIDKIEGAREVTQYSEIKFQRLLDTFLKVNIGSGQDTFDEDYELAKDTYDNLVVQYQALKRHFADVYEIQQKNPELTEKTKIELESSYQYFHTLSPVMDSILADAKILLTDYHQAVENKRLLPVNTTIKLSELTQQLLANQKRLATDLSKLIVGLQLTI